MPGTASTVGADERELWFGIDLIKQIVDFPLGTGLVVVNAIGKPRFEASRDSLEEQIGEGKLPAKCDTSVAGDLESQPLCHAGVQRHD